MNKSNDISEQDIYNMLNNLTSDDPTETLKSLIKYCGDSTQLLMDSSVALTIAEVLCVELEVLLKLVLAFRTEDNENKLFELNYRVVETIKSFRKITEHLNLPTPEEFGAIGVDSIG